MFWLFSVFPLIRLFSKRQVKVPVANTYNTSKELREKEEQILLEISEACVIKGLGGGDEKREGVGGKGKSGW